MAMDQSHRWELASAVFGAAVWLGSPALPTPSAPSFGSIEHSLLFVPLVAAPLALLLVERMLEQGRRASASSYRLARLAQPFGGMSALVSFVLPKGAAAALLVAPWLVVTLLVAGGGLRRSVLRGGAHLSGMSLLAAHVFLPLGAVWLVLSRLGVGPRGFAPLTVLLAALHFHYSGFTLQVLIAATGRALHPLRRWPALLHRSVAIGAVAGIPLIAAGNAIPSPNLKFVGVAAMTSATIGLAITSTLVALHTGRRSARLLLLSSAASLGIAMIVAGVYGWGELRGYGWIGVPRMATTHGLLNAVGFTALGLLGQLELRATRSARSSGVPGALPLRRLRG